MGALLPRDGNRVDILAPSVSGSSAYRLGKRFTQLLHHPLGGRMTSDVEMQDPAPAMLNYEKAIQELERQRGAHRALYA
jgi:hypothetical protein